jgi:hypothetical protein
VNIRILRGTDIMTRTIAAMLAAATIAGVAAPATAQTKYYAREVLVRTSVPSKTYTGTWGVSGYSSSSCVSGKKEGTPITTCTDNRVADSSKSSCDPVKEPTGKVVSACFRTCGTLVTGYYSSSRSVRDDLIVRYPAMNAANAELARKSCEDYAGVRSGEIGFSCFFTSAGQVFVRTHTTGGTVSYNSSPSFMGATCS